MEPITIRRVNAFIPTGKHGKTQRRPGTLEITDLTIEFRYGALGSATSYVVPREQIASTAVERKPFALARLIVTMTGGERAEFRMRGVDAEAAAAKLRV